jgi:hypothetical protein
MLSTASGKSIIVEQHQIQTEPQSQPAEDSIDAEVAKEALYAQPLQGVKGDESPSTKSVAELAEICRLGRLSARTLGGE